MHKGHDVVGDFDAFVAERLEQQVHAFLELLVDTETLENGKTEGDQRHDGKQRRIHETHGPQVELTTEYVA